MLRLFLTLALILNTACGAEDTDESSLSMSSLQQEEGPKGDTGATGPMGPQGETGPMGPAGRDGVDGKDGEDGTDGQNGVNGTNGTDGIDGKDGKTVSGTEWYDPIADRYWTLGAKLPFDWAVCSNGWRLATPDELRHAIARGLFLALLQLDSSANRIWVEHTSYDINGNPVPGNGFYQFSTDSAGTSGLMTDRFNYACMEE